MIRVLQVLDSLDVGGIESYLMNIYRHIDRAKVQFDFAIFKENNFFEEEAKQLGGRVFKCLNGSYKAQLRFIKELQKKNNYQIVHCHNCSLKGMIRGTLPVRYVKNRPIIIAHSHNPGMPTNTISDKVVRYALKKIITESSDYYFACSQESSDSKFLPGKDPSKYILLKNGIEVQSFLFDDKIRDKIRKKLKITDSTFVYGAVGRLEEQKNHRFLIQRFAEVAKQKNNVKLLLVGNGKLKDQLIKLAQQLGVRDKVIFAGIKDDVNDYLQAMDMFVFPSIYEGLGIALIEAQASGLPSLVSDTIPREAFVTELVTSLPLKNSNLWVKYMVKGEKNEFRSLKYVNEVRKRGYDINDVASYLQKFYLKVIEKNRGISVR